MATTIRQAFQEFRANLEITDLQASTVSTRQKNVRAAVEGDLLVLDSFLVGSYMRSTMIAPLKEADLDIFVVLDSKYFEENGHASLLDKVRCVLLKTYTSSPRISRNGQAVTITFADFVVDVVPGFHRNGGGYLIPDSVLSRWIATDPKKHVDIWADANKAHAGDLVPLIKILKAWNRAHSSALRSFHLEVLALQSLQGIKILDFPSGARYVFDKARTQLRSSASDPAGYGGPVGAYLDTPTKIDNAVSRLEAAVTKAREAEAYEQQGDIRHAIEKWQVVFGDYFPAYG